MTNRPVIFISATSDLRSARDLVGKVLFSMGYEPVWHDIEPTDGGELLEVLRRRIAPCAMMVQLVGQRYGAEPPQPTAAFGRASYTQFEALEAERVAKKVIYHFLEETFPTDAAAAEPPELTSLQTAYRQRLKDANRLRHGGIASATDLELSIRRISDDLAALRRQADRRHRHLLRLGVLGAVGIAAVAIVSIVVLNRQGRLAETVNRQTEIANTVEAKIDKEAAEMAKLRAAVAAAVSPKPLAAGRTQPEPIPLDVLAKAKVLVERGNAEERVLGMIALQQHAEADRLIQELKSKPQNPIDEAFRLLTMEGDNWYQAREPDKAITPYEKALALKPGDFRARMDLVRVLTSARLGNVASNRHRAIKIAEETLLLVPAGSTRWASMQSELAIALAWLPTGMRAENLKKAITAYEAALTVYTKAAYPSVWAMAQNNLGAVWADLPTGDKAENLRKAIASYNRALSVYTKEFHRTDWATTQNNLAVAWWKLPTGDRAENLKNAIAACDKALSVYTKEAYPTDWARIQNNLGAVWADLPTGNRSENLRNALAAYEKALTIYTKEAYPAGWAMTQNNLGLTWSDSPTGDKAENMKRAIAAYESALTVYTREAYPAEWADSLNNLGLVWANLPTGNRTENLKKAIAAYEATLTVRTRDVHHAVWALTQMNLGNAWFVLPTGNKAGNLQKAITAYEAALTAQTKDAYPAEWAKTQYSLGLAWSSFPTRNKPENLKKTIAAYEAVLTVVSAENEAQLRLSAETNLSWAQILAKDFARALSTALRELNSATPNLPLETNHAHALLFLGHSAEAGAIYFKYRGKTIEETGRTWEQTILEDFDELEKNGLTNSEMPKLRELLRPKSK